MSDLLLSRSAGLLLRGGRAFDPWSLAWRDAGSGPEDLPRDAAEVSPRAALEWLNREQGARRVPVAVIGPKQASPAQLDLAEALGRALGGLGLTVLTGGKGGVMEAASRGAKAAGALTVGLIPDEDWRAANPHVDLPLATGIGPARNALIARAAQALIAVGGEYGTLSEIAFGLHFDKPVFTLADAPAVPGAVACGDLEEVLDRLALALLGLA